MNMKSYSGVDIAKYSELVGYVSRLSALFSNSSNAAIDSRFVEKLFCILTGSRDISRNDISFDAVFGFDAGVGVKTFIANSTTSSKVEKVAEFTKNATSGLFANLNQEERAVQVSKLRNARIHSDLAELGLSLDKSFYHCLIRKPSFAIVHEEPYEAIEVDSIFPTTNTGKPKASFSEETSGHVYFSDGRNQYAFNASKNVLLKRFNLDSGFNSQKIQTPIDQNIWETLLGKSLYRDDLVGSNLSKQEDVESVILPLYSTQSLSEKRVPAKSGINQWNAGGRIRKFGEAYIPVPSLIHKINPTFFPPRDQPFLLTLPNGVQVQAKICQEGSKALMSNPNEVLCEWLFSTIDGSFENAKKRLDKNDPYTYKDLVSIGKDSVKISKTPDGPSDYKLEFAGLDSFEDFISFTQ